MDSYFALVSIVYSAFFDTKLEKKIILLAILRSKMEWC